MSSRQIESAPECGTVAAISATFRVIDYNFLAPLQFLASLVGALLVSALLVRVTSEPLVPRKRLGLFSAEFLPFSLSPSISLLKKFKENDRQERSGRLLCLNWVLNWVLAFCGCFEVHC